MCKTLTSSSHITTTVWLSDRHLSLLTRCHSGQRQSPRRLQSSTLCQYGCPPDALPTGRLCSHMSESWQSIKDLETSYQWMWFNCGWLEVEVKLKMQAKLQMKKDDGSASYTAGAKMEFIKTGQMSEQFRSKLELLVCVCVLQSMHAWCSRGIRVF